MRGCAQLGVAQSGVGGGQALERYGHLDGVRAVSLGVDGLGSAGGTHFGARQRIAVFVDHHAGDGACGCVGLCAGSLSRHDRYRTDYCGCKDDVFKHNVICILLVSDLL